MRGIIKIPPRFIVKKFIVKKAPVIAKTRVHAEFISVRITQPCHREEAHYGHIRILPHDNRWARKLLLSAPYARGNKIRWIYNYIDLLRL